MKAPQLCASPTCFCETTDFTCSLWCGPDDMPSGARCQCRHDGCLEVWAGRRSSSDSPALSDVSRVRPERRRRTAA
jgi:hypothetical protein